MTTFVKDRVRVGGLSSDGAFAHSGQSLVEGDRGRIVALPTLPQDREYRPASARKPTPPTSAVAESISRPKPQDVKVLKAVRIIITEPLSPGRSREYPEV